MRPTFDAIRRTDENGNEYWSSRDLCNAMGYSTNWKFQNVINKAIAVANQKGMNIDDHFNQTVDMVKLGSGAYRKVNIFRLSRMADLFGVDVRTVNYHLGQIYETGELQKEATIRKIGIVQNEGDCDVERTPLFYNLDAFLCSRLTSIQRKNEFACQAGGLLQNPSN